MALLGLNIIGGLKRIYLVATVAWVLTFAYGVKINMEAEIVKKYPIAEVSCDDLQQRYVKEGDFKLKPLDDTPELYFYTDDEVRIHASIPYSKLINYPNYELYDDWKGKCYTKYVRSFIDRIKDSEKSMILLYLIFLPIPLYFIIVFILKGFVKNR